LFIHGAGLPGHDAEPAAYTVGNIQGTINVALAARKLGARLVYPSTDYLGARNESDPVRPVNAYAGSKLAGEVVVSGVQGLVVRGSWYSRLDYSHAATDAFCTKLPVAQAAHWIAVLSTSTHTGVVNIGGPRRSLYELALQFNERVIPVSRHQIRCGYEIPADASLDTTRLTRILAA
jgi:dTDP-4-dehydrorhamnose reductase